MLQLKQL
jgi:hypothetical protein